MVVHYRLFLHRHHPKYNFTITIQINNGCTLERERRSRDLDRPPRDRLLWRRLLGETSFENDL